jgi:hypothetical protein
MYPSMTNDGKPGGICPLVVGVVKKVPILDTKS